MELKSLKFNYFAFALLFLFIAPSSAWLDSVAQRGKNFGQLSANMGKGIVQNVPNMIPSPESIFRLSKQGLLGLPTEALLTAIDKVCSYATAARNSTMPYKQPKLEEMNYVLMTDTENISIPVTESLRLWRHEKFDPQKKVVVMVTGWNSDIDEENSAADGLWAAYRSRGDTNFVLIDTARYVDTLYAWSAFNTMDLGHGLGLGLTELADVVPIDNIHVMGHSLGAHIVGFAGRVFQEKTDRILKRISGFDPARPCFREGEVLQGLGRGDAEFVDIIHSNSGALGKTDPIGDADFYPNGIVSVMPGCVSFLCSHSRAWKYYAESVYKGNEMNFIAKKCGSLYSYETNACIRKEIPMGFSCPSTAKGNFFLKTNSHSPFGRGKFSLFK
ncbi:CLUMA_CG000039, isoform A [Clunio marinus]|uniref:CLUMA_CG000039, isoform A n=1 Tax=Clunio marinus TaxID=568069 RepID=A0A1J1HIX6_9DIPT|nr:CLUMA_CG000039, isoform A [Clunio marinus]